MKRFFSFRNIATPLLLLIAFFSLQVVFFLNTYSAKAVTLEYLGRGVCFESQMSIERDYYGKGKDRWTVQIPEFDEEFRMHTATFEWNENKHVPPDAETKLHDVWVGTCTLTPKSPWRYIDVFGILGPLECSVYGDWSVKSKW